MSAREQIYQPWAIERGAFEALREFHLNASTGLSAGARPVSFAGASPGLQVNGAVAVVPLWGVLMRSPDAFDRMFGAVSLQEIESDFKTALADPRVSSIVLDINSPGGSVSGIQEFSRTVYAARAQKQIVALGNGQMCSAAYWVGAAADAIYASSGTVLMGSIGVVAQHVDISERQRLQGVKITSVAAGKFKGAGSPNAPLSDEDRGTIQAQVDYLYSIFVEDVAKMRATSTADVLTNMAEGRVFIGTQSVSAGLADGIKSLEELVGGLGGGAIARMRSVAAVSAPAMRAAPAAESVQTLEQRLWARWGREPALRAEFGGVWESFLAIERREANKTTQSRRR